VQPFVKCAPLVVGKTGRLSRATVSFLLVGLLIVSLSCLSPLCGLRSRILLSFVCLFILFQAALLRVPLALEPTPEEVTLHTHIHTHIPQPKQTTTTKIKRKQNVQKKPQKLILN
jgi:hypothetical protein